jgi:hypothetical protein
MAQQRHPADVPQVGAHQVTAGRHWGGIGIENGQGRHGAGELRNLFVSQSYHLF